MNTLTRRGICKTLEYSPYFVKITYGVEELMYVFSSQLHLDKFNKKLKENRNKINYSLSKRFGFDIIENMIADISLYIKTENRGFLIKGNGDFKWQNTIRLDGVKLMSKN